MSDAPLRRGSIFELLIEKMTFGDSGLGRYQGLVIFVPYTTAGERVRVKITELKKDYAKAEVQEILSIGPGRRKPPCEYYEKCGGCDWQHLSYAEQIKSKKQVLSDILQRQKIFWEKDIQFFEAQNEWNYRNRIQVFDNGHGVGFRKKNSHETISIRQCLIAEPSINEELQNLVPTNRGRFEIRTRDKNHSGFEQVHTSQNDVLVQWLINQVQAEQPKSILDLYCGSGNLSFPLLEKRKNRAVTGVEAHADSVSKAIARSKQLGVSDQAQFICSEVDQYLSNSPGEFDVIVLDPPREGAGVSVMKSLNQMSVKKLIYVSCDPMTWARDVRQLQKLDDRWKVESLQGLDLFPQTHHIEILSVLSRF
jgi:23S rRNA (uracil1939-C5)-methyltransferase